MSGLRTHYQESILDNVLSNSLRDTYHFNRYGELEVNYTNLEEAFVDEYGKEVGYLLFNDICDEVDIEDKAIETNQAMSETVREDLYDTLSTMNHGLYTQKTA